MISNSPSFTPFKQRPDSGGAPNLSFRKNDLPKNYPDNDLDYFYRRHTKIKPLKIDGQTKKGKSVSKTKDTYQSLPPPHFTTMIKLDEKLRGGEYVSATMRFVSDKSRVPLPSSSMHYCLCVTFSLEIMSLASDFFDRNRGSTPPPPRP